METIKLNQGNLSRIQKNASVPGYDRKNLLPEIVHIGLGNFHRAHQASYLDKLLEKGLEKSGIFEINLIPDAAFPIANILSGQDNLYTLITKSPGGESNVRISGSILGYLNASANKKAALERIADDRTSLVTLTVTEGGYYYKKKTNEIDTRDPAVLRDLENPEEPKTAAAVLAAALALRYKSGKRPLTIMSCDNIPSNGKVLENCVGFFCRELYPDICPWVKDQVSFPCSMVDRITPVTTGALIRELEDNYGISDLWPVCGEDFIQWVL
ncbi:MAG: mannitol dehydrogenase family protein, partial [Treponema sp.]|nr:mannitol dehydrogenase family protein [Treponema sp.]